jgi:hypothetical protein
MDEDSPAPEAKEKPSQVPSWVTLGFALGALFVMALPKRPPDAVAQAPAELPALKAAAPPRLTTIEAVFADWGKYAQWSGAVTEVGLWNPETKSYSDYFEVLKTGNGLYFRSIPALMTPVVNHGIPTECPLEFAEAAHAEAFGTEEKADMNAISQSINESFGPAELPKPAIPK